MFYLYLLIITLLSVYVIFLKKINEFTNPLIIFLWLWFFVQLLYSGGAYNRPEISSYSLLIVNTSLVMFVLGFVISQTKTKKKMNLPQVNNVKIYNDKILILLAVASIISILPTFFTQFGNFLNGNSFGDNKHLLMNGEVSLGIAYVYFGKPMRIILSMLAAIALTNEKRNTLFINLVVVLMFMDYVCTGSKNIFFTWGLYIILLLVLRRGKSMRDLLRKYNKTIFLASFSIAAVLYFMSKSNEMFKKLYFYVSGNLPFLDYSLRNMQLHYPDSTFGFVTFNGVLRLPFVLLNFLGMDFYPEILFRSDNYLLLMDNFIYLNENTIFNAFTTIFFYFYLDFKWYGVIFGGFVFGYLSSVIYSKAVRHQSAYNYLLYLFLISIILNSVAKSLLASPSHAMALIFLLTVFKVILTKKIVF